jgi:hypothetical protein
MVKLSAEQAQHEISKHALRDAGAELAGLRDKLELAQRRTPSIECQEMLADLMSGGTLLHITRINPNDVFLQSPRASR